MISNRRNAALEEYGIIGNLRTVALISKTGSLDWMCLPDFAAPSVFGHLIDSERGGRFQITTDTPSRSKQFYLAETAILVTRFITSEGVGEITDFIAIPQDPKKADGLTLYRIVRTIRGRMRYRLDCAPAFNYGQEHARALLRSGEAIFESASGKLSLYHDIPSRLREGRLHGTWDARGGQKQTFILHFKSASDATPEEHILDDETAQTESLHYWRRWSNRTTYGGRWRESVIRSALTLKLLTYSPTGAIVASPTTSLPESSQGGRNWDYRYTWLRDSSFTLRALLRLGFHEEARSFVGWLQARLGDIDSRGHLQPFYGIHGEEKIPEKILSHLSGYNGLGPVRIGNAAFGQVQMDVYGEVMDSIYLFNKYVEPISHDLWQLVRRLLARVCDDWHHKDRGLWEVRGAPRHFVHSKVMCWVALDRGIRMAQKRSLPGDLARWFKVRNQIYDEVMKKGWSDKLGTFVQSYGSKEADASCLIFPLVKFIAPTDPRVLKTLQRVKTTLVSDSLVKRYQTTPSRNAVDGIRGEEGSFSMCTFWYAEALARSGQLEEAQWVFEKMLGYAGPLGLYSEEINAQGEQIGNFPQAFTHVGLISAATDLNSALSDQFKRR